MYPLHMPYKLKSVCKTTNIKTTYLNVQLIEIILFQIHMAMS